MYTSIGGGVSRVSRGDAAGNTFAASGNTVSLDQDVGEQAATAKKEGSSRYASSIRARSTRLAGSVRERAIAPNAIAHKFGLEVLREHCAVNLIEVDDTYLTGWIDEALTAS
jgi:hypothetical protein